MFAKNGRNSMLYVDVDVFIKCNWRYNINKPQINTITIDIIRHLKYSENENPHLLLEITFLFPCEQQE